MHHCLRAKPLLFNASQFLNPKLEVYGKKQKPNKNPGGKLASYYTRFIFLLILFLFYGCTALNI